MERTKPDKDAILWKKTGGGSFHATIGGKQVIIKPGQQFYAKEDEIPLAFRAQIEPVDPVAVRRQEKLLDEKVVEEVTSKPKYFLKISKKNPGFWLAESVTVIKQQVFRTF